MPSKLQRRTLGLKSRTITKIEEGSTADSRKFDPRVAFGTAGVFASELYANTATALTSPILTPTFYAVAI